MARMPRIVVPGQALHIVQRGNNRQAVFFTDEDYQLYLETLGEFAGELDCSVHAYVLMTNHVHLLVTPSTKVGPARLMQALGRKYVRYVNGTYKRTGTLWEGRYKSAIIDSENYLLACSRYIEMNPVRANMVDAPGEYQWSSYHCNALGVEDEIVTEHDVYRRLGISRQKRLSVYRKLFSSYLDKQLLDDIRSNTNKCSVIGNDRFREEIELAVNRRLVRLEHGGDRKSKQFNGLKNMIIKCTDPLKTDWKI